MIAEFSSVASRPNRLEEKKDERYHLEWGKWAMRSMGNQYYLDFISKAYINWSFFKGQKYQWLFEEDMAGFFMDESGEPRHRIRVSYNLIKSMVNQFVGNAIRLDFNARAESLNDLVRNKLEERLNRLFDYHEIIDAYPVIEETIRKRVPLGKDKAETEKLVRLSKVDEVADAANSLITVLAEKVDIQEIKVRGARHLCLTGMSVYHAGEYNLHYHGGIVEPWKYFWDAAATKSDFSDAQFMGHWDYMDASYVFERYDALSTAERQTIEKYCANASSSSTRRLYDFMFPNHDSRVPVYNVCWKDIVTKEYAWVKDKDGYIDLLCIDRGSEYGPKDIVDKEELTKEQLDVTGGKLRKRMIVDEIRYCVFTPAEEIGAPQDIVYEYGVLPFQEDDPIRPESSKFPYKVQTWIYENHEVLTPLDDAIDPQRLINRLLSIQESSFNRAHGGGAIIAAESIDDEDGEEGTRMKMNRGEMITVRAQQVGGVQNAVGRYESNMGQTAANIQPFVEMMKVAFRDVTAVNESMTGTMGASQSLVGVVQEQINQGTIVQEPFYYSLTRWLQQIYQNFAQSGRKIYVKNPKMLSLIAGDRHRDLLTHIDDLALESWRVFIKRAQPESTEIQKADEMIMFLLQMQMMDQNLAAQLLGRSTTDLVYDQLRKYQGKLAIAEEEAKRQQEEIIAGQMQAEQQQQQFQNEVQTQEILRDQQNKDADRMTDYLKAQERNETSIERDLIRNL